MATAVATRTAVATNIAHAACEKNKTCFLQMAKEFSKKTKRATTHETHAKLLKTHVKIATAAAIRANSL